MVRRKIDNRIRLLIENGVKLGHRTMFVIVGDKGRDQVVILHHMLSKAAIKARPSVLWCYKKELGFSSNRKKRMKELQKKIKAGRLNVNEDDPFELFVSSTEIRYCYYSETHKILGSTYGMCVLQDFEAVTPNLLARTIETVEGGGLIVLLLRSVSSLRQLYTLSMDVHERFRTEAHQDIVGRFNERFLLSLASCTRCLVVDDTLGVLPLSSHVLALEAVTDEEIGPSESHTQLVELKASLADTQPVGVLVALCKTLDQSRALLKFVEAISEKSLRSTVSLTAARGRGKSAALGLAMSAAVAFGYSNIFVTSPSPENLKTLFEFVFKGFDALQYQEHLDYDLVQSTNPEFNKAVVRINIFRDHRQTIQYIHPSDAHKLGQAELVVIDEAAAIPLPLVRALLGPYLVFLSSTINGYEGTGRSLSLKLLQQLRSQSSTTSVVNKPASAATTGRTLQEVTLNESIRYKPGDALESWLTSLLCLDATNVEPLLSGCPPPDSCDLYYINRDTLFCYHKASEAFLQRLMALYVASHYKNSPNDLQMLSDAPAHHLFCLLGPVDPQQRKLPEVLAVIQVCLEGQVSQASVTGSLQRGRRAAGDLIPWTVAQQFQDKEFPQLSGARVVRIATHPDYQGMGYGSRAITLLKRYYRLEIPSVEESERPQEAIEPVEAEDVGLLEEVIEPRKALPPLLLKLNERPPERLDYIGVSFGVTPQLLKFWKRSGFLPVYLRQTAHELTGEHSCIMLHSLHDDDEQGRTTWMMDFWKDFRRRFVSLMSFQFKNLSPSFALSMLQNQKRKEQYDQPSELTRSEMNAHVTPHDVARLEMYCDNLVDYHLIMDLVPTLARLYFLRRLGATHLSAVQAAILLGVGLQHRDVDDLSTELQLPSAQLLGLFNRAMRKLASNLRSVLESEAAHVLQLPDPKRQDDGLMQPLPQSLSDELENAAQSLKEQQTEQKQLMKRQDLSQFAIKGSEDEWGKALSTKAAGSLVSIKSGQKRLLIGEQAANADDSKGHSKKRQKQKNKRH